MAIHQLKIATGLKNSSAFNVSKGKFENRRPELIETMRENSFSFELLKEWFSEREGAKPATKLPEQLPYIREFEEPAEYTKLIWLGHSTFVPRGNFAGTFGC